MKAPFYTTRGKSIYSYLSYDVSNGHVTGMKWGRGFYISKWGDAIRIHANWNHPKIPDQTNLEYIHNGIIHKKVYYRTFSDRGLCCIAAAFITFVENL